MSTPAFDLPEALEAAEPPEARGVARDEVRLMVATRERGRDRARDRSATCPTCSRPATWWSSTSRRRCRRRSQATRLADGSRTRVHFSTRAPRLDQSWRVVELRSADGSRPARARAGERIRLSRRREPRAGRPVRVRRPADARPFRGRRQGSRTTSRPTASRSATATCGAGWPIDDYQTVYATTPGSAEMPSAGRPFTAGLITRLLASGVAGRADHAPHRSLIAGAPRGSVPRVLRGPGGDGEPDRDRPRRGRARDRRRHHRRPSARVGARQRADSSAGLDEPRDHP